MNNIKEDINNIKEDINNLFNKIEDNNDLLKSFFLKKIINMEYFGNLYENFVLVEIEENKYKIIKLYENNAVGFTNETFGSSFIGYNKDDEYESQFLYYKDIKKIFLKDKDYNSINDLFDQLIKTKNFNEFKKILNKKNNNDDIIILKQISMNRSYNNKEVENSINELIKIFEKIIYKDNGVIVNKIKKTKMYVEYKTKKGIFDAILNKNDKLIFNDIDINNKKNWKNFISILKKIRIDFKSKFYSESSLEIDQDVIKNFEFSLLNKYPELNSLNNDIKFYLINTKSNNVDYVNSKNQELDSIYELKGDNLIEFKIKNNDFIEFIFKSNMVILSNKENDKKYKGLVYLDNHIFKYKEKNSYLVIKNKNETIGLVSFYSKNNNYIKKIATISLDYRYRNTMLLNKIYKELHDLSIKSKFIITTDNYTNQGRLNIPKLKKDLNQKGVVFIDMTYSDCYTDLELDVNRFFIEKIESLSENNYLLNYDKNISIYKDAIKKVNNENKNDFSYNEKRKLLSYLLKDINNNNKLKNDI